MSDREISELMREIEIMKKTQEQHNQQLEAKSKEIEKQLRRKVDVIGFQLSVQNLRLGTESLEKEVISFQKKRQEELTDVGLMQKVLTDAYHAALAENVKLFNEVQKLKVAMRGERKGATTQASSSAGKSLKRSVMNGGDDVVAGGDSNTLTEDHVQERRFDKSNGCRIRRKKKLNVRLRGYFMSATNVEGNDGEAVRAEGGDIKEKASSEKRGGQ